MGSDDSDGDETHCPPSNLGSLTPAAKKRCAVCKSTSCLKTSNPFDLKVDLDFVDINPQTGLPRLTNWVIVGVTC